MTAQWQGAAACTGLGLVQVHRRHSLACKSCQHKPRTNLTCKHGPGCLVCLLITGAEGQVVGSTCKARLCLLDQHLRKAVAVRWQSVTGCGCVAGGRQRLAMPPYAPADRMQSCSVQELSAHNCGWSLKTSLIRYSPA